ncbi:unnamed protein product [Allacma fusca]|uniref:Uncharacterized protein n=1 Tax=Allacma fusca TaxID=39272 RepID=A0A8J2JJG1_9HEXA|nr:unnamed protein product [Allacma fusca]
MLGESKDYCCIASPCLSATLNSVLTLNVSGRSLNFLPSTEFSKMADEDCLNFFTLGSDALPNKAEGQDLDGGRDRRRRKKVSASRDRRRRKKTASSRDRRRRKSGAMNRRRRKSAAGGRDRRRRKSASAGRERRRRRSASPAAMAANP